ncbi:MAG: thiamine pyrophosphate-dependent dehydrogenase E1 component subunit alpha [Spirochaetaceae bacterium]|nr:thiamine pyrophosphate-dependent dehydrogenase E1 component subunit alpha [Spirochaetaceae bacterium]
MKPKKTELKDAFLKMNHIRLFEEKVAWFFSRGMIHGTTHLYVGEEACAVGACAALGADDMITSTHRGHGHCIARGIDRNRMMAELLGRETGYCKGKGDSMHIGDLTVGNLGANGTVGGGIPIATGAGLSLQMRKVNGIVVCFFGDGALNQGAFHETVNMASVWNLPVLYICENNQYGMSMSVNRSIKPDDLSVRAAAYGIPGETIDGNDYFIVRDAVDRIKNHVMTEGPALIVAETYRFLGHSKSDANKYRTKDEIARWKKKDPIKRFRDRVLAEGWLKTEELDALTGQAASDIEKAVVFAEKQPYPGIESIHEDV